MDPSENIFQNLNNEQCEAVRATEGTVKVIAGAGSGKTRVLAHRYAHLVNNLGIDPGNIICTTFTNKAAQEMRSRIAKMVPTWNTNDFVCTLHGLCVKILRRDIHRLGWPKTFSILDEEDSKQLAGQVLETFGLERSAKTIQELRQQVNGYKSCCQGEYIPDYMMPKSPGFVDTTGHTPLESYLHQQALNYGLDFIDLIIFTTYLFENYPEVAAYWQDKANYIMVDESQDCSTADWIIAKTLAEKYGNLFMVGDPDQLIYEWRGVKPDSFVDWKADTEIILNENYRSTPNILGVANSVIVNNKNRIPKDLYTKKQAADNVVHFHGKNDNDEAKWIAKQIATLVKHGASFSDFAILFRASYMSRCIEQALLKSKIPYVIWGGIRFFERQEVKDSLAYLKLIANNDNLSFARIINMPKRKFGKSSLAKLKELSEIRQLSLYDTLKCEIDQWKNTKAYPFLVEFIRIIEDCKIKKDEMSVANLLNHILKETGLTESYRLDTDVDRLENVEELISSIRTYESQHDEDETKLEEYLQDIALYTNADYKIDDKTVKLMTIHQSKGLEFPYVFVCGLSEGAFPSHRSLRDRKRRGLEEERRLMYVAITRAEVKLFLTEAEGFNFQTKTEKFPSRFLTEIKKSFLIQEGIMDESLWEGTRALARSIDQEIDDTREKDSIAVGSEVRHEFFGTGTVIEIDRESNKVKVRFGSDEKSERYLQIKSISIV